MRELPAVALSVRQPWAWLIVHGSKDIENRTWRTKRRGPIWIHTGLSLDRPAYERLRWTMPDVDLPDPSDLPLGCVVGRASITGCVRLSDSPWFDGPFGLVLSDRAPLALPLDARGRLGFFTLPNELQATLAREVRA